MRTKALDEGNCAAARPGGKEAGVKTTSPRTETGCEAGDADELAPHSEVRVSASQVKPGVVSRKSHPLPGETCPAGAAACAQSAVTGNSGGQRTGVSRGRSSAGNEPGVGVHLPRGALKGPEGLTHARRTELIGIAETAAASSLELALMPALQRGRSQAAEKDCGRKNPDFPCGFLDHLSRSAGAAGRIESIGTARYGPVRRVVWGPGRETSPATRLASFSLFPPASVIAGC
jgi:hypothetical protein